MQLSIRNFKCFEHQAINLGRLTLLTVANGAGKSSAIQALLLMRSALDHLPSQLFHEGADPGLGSNPDIPLPINGPYHLQLGEASLLFNQFLEEADISLSLHQCHQPLSDGQIPMEVVLGIDFQESTQDSLSLNIADFIGEMPAEMPWLGSFFYYLSAERHGPRHLQEAQHTPYPHCGYRGENTAWVLAQNSYNLKVPAERRLQHGPAALPNNPNLNQQLNAWLGYIMPGTRVNAVSFQGSMAAQIRIENTNNSNAPTTSPNIGFGISYLLPVLLNGLIAQPESLYIIENPEAHLHPQAQSRLGRFLAQMAHAGVPILLETHSEHILNGIRLASLEGQIGEQEVVINFFKASNHEPVQELPLSIVGQHSRYPPGFFDASQEELVEIEWQHDIQQGESKTREFKGSWLQDIKGKMQLSQKEISRRVAGWSLQTLAALMNSEGGTLYVGVYEPDGKSNELEYRGLDPDYDILKGGRDELLKDVSSRVSDRLSEGSQSLIRCEIRSIQGVDIMRIEVKPASSPVFYYPPDNKAASEFWIREQAGKRSLNHEEMLQYRQEHWVG